MKAKNIFTLTLLAVLIFSSPLNAQEIITDFGEVSSMKGPYVTVGIHGSKEIRLHGKRDRLEIHDKQKRIAREKVSYKTDEGQALVDEIIFKKDEIVMFSLVSSPKDQALYYKTLSYDDLSTIKSPVKISGLEEISKNSVPSVFRASVAKFDAYYNKKSEHITLVVTAKPNKDGAKNFVEIITLDKDYNTVRESYIFYAKDADNELKISDIVTYDNGTVAAVIAETNRKTVLGYTLIYLTNHEPVEVEVLPALDRIEGYKLSSNIQNDQFSFTIFSVDSEDLKQGAITVYKYDTKEHMIESETYSINESDLNQKRKNSLHRYKVYDNYIMENGSIIVTLSNSYSTVRQRNDGSIRVTNFENGFFIISLDKNLGISWSTEIPRNAYSTYSKIISTLSYYTKNGEMEIIFNTNAAQFKEGFYNYDVGRGGAYLPFVKAREFIPTKATIHLSSGEVSVEELKFNDGRSINAIHPEILEKDEEPGVYTLKANIGKKLNILKIDFK